MEIFSGGVEGESLVAYCIYCQDLAVNLARAKSHKEGKREFYREEIKKKGEDE